MQFLPEAVSRTIARQAFAVDRNSPTLLFGAGVVGMVGSTVLACRATLKMESLLDATKKEIEEVKYFKPREDQEYNEKDRSKDISIIYVQTSVKIARLYGPAVVVGGASVAALSQSHNILTRRNAALTAAYAALDKGFAEYRQRVVDKYGEEEDRNFRYGSCEVDIVEDGKKKTVTRVGDGSPSIYARFFDPLSTKWSKEPEYNLLLLKCQQTYANDLLRARGHVFLNEVYDMIGVPRSKAGSVVGWILMGNVRDNWIDFGIWDDDDNVRDFVNGREASILLDFNVDGVIYDKIDTPTEALSWQMGN